MRLIDVESLDILGYLEELPESEEDRAWNMAVRAIYDYINFADTIYLGPIVKCKDCKYYYLEQEPWQGKTVRYCALRKGLGEPERETFCSYGERKDVNE